jgi:hypothetical protein
MRTLAAVALALLALEASAQQWTVQAAAFQDYRQATALVAELSALGLDAYTEFVMQDGRQYARVRAGCFSTRDAADSSAGDIRGRITAEAVAQPLTTGATPRACIDWVPGFLKPAVWQIVRRATDIVFRVEFGGQVGYLLHDGSGWQFGHALPNATRGSRSEPAGFREVSVGGAALTQARLADGSWVYACGGRLLWQQGRTAVVERADSVIACVVDESGHRGGD